MLKKRIIVCLDVKDGRTTKGVKFLDNRDVGDPVMLAKKYYLEGADELVFYDIMASAEGKRPIIELIKKVAREIFIPFCVGGGINTMAEIREIISAGAEKVSLNSGAIKSPELISEARKVFGSQSVVLGVDLKKDERSPSGYRVYANGGRVDTGLDGTEWVKRAVKLGAGEVVLNSIDSDGMKEGYDVELVKLMNLAVDVPIIASGGAGKVEHLARVFASDVGASAALVASMVHLDGYTVGSIKQELSSVYHIPVRAA